MEPHEIRAGFAHELGCKLDDMLEAAKLEVARGEGSRTALQMAAKKVSELALAVNKDLDEGKLDNLEGSLAIAGVIKDYLTRAVTALESGVVAAESHRLQVQGRVQAFEMIVGNVKKIHDLEQGQANLRKVVGDTAPVEGQARTTGIAPGLPLRERRRLEEEAAKAAETAAAAKAEDVADAPPVTDTAPVAEPPAPAKKTNSKPKGRPQKGHG